MRGMFAFAIWDAPKRRLVLARDRLGKKPLFFHVGKRGARRSRPSCRRCSPTATSNAAPTARRSHAYLALGYVPSDFAAIAGVRKLAPGSIAVFEDGKLAEERYWKLRFEPRQRSAEDFVEELRHHLFEAVKLRLVSDVPLGAFLSGGIDSSAVVAIMSKVGREAGQDVLDRLRREGLLRGDATRARSRACYETDHHEEVLRPRRRRAAARAGARYGEPFADPSALPTYLLSRDDPPPRHRRAVGRRRRRGASPATRATRTRR